MQWQWCSVVGSVVMDVGVAHWWGSGAGVVLIVGRRRCCSVRVVVDVR